MQRLVTLVLAAAALLAGQAGAGALTGLEGSWRTVRHGADVEIRDCGDGSPCGYLVAVNAQVTGGRHLDERNPDAALRARPLAGLPLMWGFASARQGWQGGRLYNPETGQTFRASMTLISADQLRVRGCLGPLCRAQVWTRIDTRTAKGPQDE
ncbi:MAG: DUF2147 domain-containing protein [Hyphomonas sp.]|nr:DUF2147 domain-containing protein [Hyphomonas sp.]